VAPSRRTLTVAKTAVWIVALTPALLLGWDALRDNLSANPIEEITDRTGFWTLTMLAATLAITPIRLLTGRHWIVKFRRLVGLFAFFYASLHLSTYIFLDRFLEFGTVLEDVAERPFITVGFATWLILFSLAFTSTRGWIRRLGKKWQRLHRLVYLAVGLGCLHFYWGVKADTRVPLIFIAIFSALLALRIPPIKRGISAIGRARPRRTRDRSPEARPAQTA